MSRFDSYDYDDYDDDPLADGRWQRNTVVCVSGKPGQAALRRLEAALLALPTQRLVAGKLATPEGDVCAVGALVAASDAAEHGTSITDAIRTLADSYSYIDAAERAEWRDQTIWAGKSVGLTMTLAWVLGDLNDVVYSGLTPEDRYARVLRWVRARIVTGAGTYGQHI